MGKEVYIQNKNLKKLEQIMLDKNFSHYNDSLKYLLDFAEAHGLDVLGDDSDNM